jgi:hypothetical protein
MVPMKMLSFGFHHKTIFHVSMVQVSLSTAWHINDLSPGLQDCPIDFSNLGPIFRMIEKRMVFILCPWPRISVQGFFCGDTSVLRCLTTDPLGNARKGYTVRKTESPYDYALG